MIIDDHLSNIFIDYRLNQTLLTNFCSVKDNLLDVIANKFILISCLYVFYFEIIASRSNQQVKHRVGFIVVIRPSLKFPVEIINFRIMLIYKIMFKRCN